MEAEAHSTEIAVRVWIASADQFTFEQQSGITDRVSEPAGPAQVVCVGTSGIVPGLSVAIPQNT
jgi:hypothetical protein